MNRLKNMTYTYNGMLFSPRRGRASNHMKNGILVDGVEIHTGALFIVKGNIANCYSGIIGVNPGCFIQIGTYDVPGG